LSFFPTLPHIHTHTYMHAHTHTHTQGTGTLYPAGQASACGVSAGTRKRRRRHRGRCVCVCAMCVPRVCCVGGCVMCVLCECSRMCVLRLYYAIYMNIYWLLLFYRNKRCPGSVKSRCRICDGVCVYNRHVWLF
jgi:hypothetical protein